MGAYSWRHLYSLSPVIRGEGRGGGLLQPATRNPQTPPPWKRIQTLAHRPPSPLAGEGRGEGEARELSCEIPQTEPPRSPHTLTLSRKGRGDQSEESPPGWVFEPLL